MNEVSSKQMLKRLLEVAQILQQARHAHAQPMQQPQTQPTVIKGDTHVRSK